ncbi:T9SS type A sorting domain-containing protein [Pontibacter sp. 13R65]|uniref:T9SS type A sorting domain-containing protein n=1 Tax=Pontibacter sp. 13R65 TaxID=3127458 RepID=UPI00301D3C5E
MKKIVLFRLIGNCPMLLLLFLILLQPVATKAQVSIEAGATITQRFNDIGSSATAALPTGWRADNLTAVRTVSSYGSARTTTLQAGSSAMTVHGIYNFGSTLDASDRAIGGLSSSTDSRSVNLYVELQNTGNSQIRDFTVSYQIEKFRNGTNAAGFTIQLFYSATGEPGTWIPAGDEFKTSFAGSDPSNAGSGTTGNAPLQIVPIVEKKLARTLATQEKLYLAWNYSVTSGSITSNAQALGVDDIFLTAHHENELIPTVATPTIQPNAPFCAGTNVSVSFNTTGTFNRSNVFTAQLSDANGSFNSPIATVPGVSPVILPIPASAVQSSNYKVRVISSSPASNSPDSAPFIINASPAINQVSLSSDNDQIISTSGSGTALTATASAASHIIWMKSTNPESGYSPITGASGAVYTPTSAHFGPVGVYFLKAQATTICGNVIGLSQPVKISVSAPVLITTPESYDFGYADTNLPSSFPIFSMQVNAHYLTDNLTLTVPPNTGFRIRLGSTANFVQSLTIPAVNGAVAGTTVQIRFEPTAAVTYKTNMIISTAGTADKLFSLVGAGSERPAVTSSPVTNVLAVSAITGGEVSTKPGDAPVVARGVVYGTTNNNLTANWSAHTTTTDGTGLGKFTSQLNNLVPATTYYVRAYATNGAGTSYGTTQSFTTPAVELASRPTEPAQLTITNTSYNRITLAMAGGDGSKRLVMVRAGSPVQTVPTNGVTYRANAVFGNGTQVGSGTFVVYTGNGRETTISGLAPNTSYFIAAFEYNDNDSPYAEHYLSDLPAGAEQLTAPAPGQLLLEDNFEVPISTPLTANGWQVHSGAETNAIKVAAPAFRYASYGSSGIGHAASLTTSGQDLNKTFEAVPPNTSVYSSFLVQVSSAAATGDFFLHFGNINTQFRARVFAKSGTAPNTVNFGISGSTNTAAYAPENYSLGTTLLLVVRFDFDGIGHSTTTLYVNPKNLYQEDEQTGLSVSEVPASGNATASINSIALRQGTASLAPRLSVSGLRVATSYEMALGNPTFSGTDQTLATGNYHSLHVNGEENALILTGPVMVHGTLTLSRGRIVTSMDSRLTLSASAKVAGGNTNSFVQGPLQIVSARTEDELYFPLGQDKEFKPVRLKVKHAVAVPTGYNAAYAPSAPSVRILPGTITDIVGNGHFNITSDNPKNVVEAFVTLPFEGITEPWKLKIAKSNGNEWLDLGGTLSDETASSGYITSAIPFNTFSDFVLGTNSGMSLRSMPVELISFKGKRTGKTIELTWQTALEKNNKHFEIERSSNGKDYITVGQESGHGNISQLTTYTFEDVNPPHQTLYYRLKQIDFDGAYAYSTVIAVPLAAYEASLEIYPNPTSNMLYLKPEPNQEFDILEVTDLMGQTIIRKSLQKNAALLPLDVSTLPNGSYVLSLRSATHAARAKFVKVR